MQFNATVKIEEINPKQAEAMLEKQYHNQRHMRETWVQRLVGEMQAGNFKLSCDAVVLVDGVLMNGQHRLNAVAASGVTCPFLVMRSDDPEIYRIIDAGIKRQISDVIVGEHRIAVSSISSWIIQYDSKALTYSTRRRRTNSSRQLLRSGQLEFIDKNRVELQSVANTVKQLWDKNKFLAPSLAGAILFLGNRERGDDSGTRFVTAVYGGTAGRAIQAVRDALVNNRISRRKLPASALFAFLIKAFKSWEQGTVPTLRVRDSEVFPRFDSQPIASK